MKPGLPGFLEGIVGGKITKYKWDCLKTGSTIIKGIELVLTKKVGLADTVQFKILGALLIIPC